MERLTREQAIEILKQLGFLIPFESVEAYHGRAEKPNEKWSVIPNFISKNFKYGVPLLCTGTKETAQNFAEHAASENKGTVPKIHKIVSNKKGALLINRNFDIGSLNDNERELYFNAIFEIGTFKLSKLSPPPYEYKNNFMKLVMLLADEVNKSEEKIITFDFANEVYKKNKLYLKNIEKEYFYKVAGIMNTKVISRIDPNYLLFRYSISSDEVYKDNIFFDDNFNLVENYNKDLNVAPFDREYFASYLHENNIIGFKFDIDSYINNKVMNYYILFATDEICTEKDYKLKEERKQNEAKGLIGLLDSLKINDNFLKIFSSSSPEELLQRLNKLSQISNLLSLDAGNWEGFSIGEHTETVLRTFNDSYENEFSEELLPYLRLIIALHDIGKGVAVEKFDKHDQSEYNVRYAEKILKDYNFDKKFIELINFIINKSQKITTNLFVRENLDSKQSLLTESKNKLNQIFGKNMTDQEVIMLAKICTMLQTCDSGAYTPYGVTRDKYSDEYYKNGNEYFAMPFIVPTDVRKRKLRFKVLNGEILSENNKNSELGN